MLIIYSRGSCKNEGTTQNGPKCAEDMHCAEGTRGAWSEVERAFKSTNEQSRPSIPTFESLDVEADGGDDLRVLVLLRLEVVEDCRLARVVQPHHQDIALALLQAEHIGQPVKETHCSSDSILWHRMRVWTKAHIKLSKLFRKSQKILPYQMLEIIICASIL